MIGPAATPEWEDGCVHLPASDIPPLPALRSPAAWRSVPIDPVDEPLVPVADIHARIHDDPQYFRWGLPGTHSQNWVRAGVAQRLARVADRLPDALTLVVWDGWRSFATQEALYTTWRGQLATDHPDWSSDRLDQEAARYVSVPSAEPDRPAPHITGGAVDLTLADATGTPLDMGTAFDAFVPEAGALALEEHSGPQRERRRLLFWAMIAEGFTAYVEEWWHFDYGDQFWASVTGCAARYGPTTPAA